MRKISLSLALGISLLGVCFAAQPYPVWEERDVPNPNPRQDRPNILWITCEDISPYLGCYGVEQALTPNLDKLAENGVRYTRAYAATTVCAVSRSSILTGMFSPVTTRVADFGALFRNHICSARSSSMI